MGGGINIEWLRESQVNAGLCLCASNLVRSPLQARVWAAELVPQRECAAAAASLFGRPTYVRAPHHMSWRKDVCSFNMMSTTRSFSMLCRTRVDISRQSDETPKREFVGDRALT
jgi:hypothetical protein